DRNATEVSSIRKRLPRRQTAGHAGGGQVEADIGVGGVHGELGGGEAPIGASHGLERSVRVQVRHFFQHQVHGLARLESGTAYGDGFAGMVIFLVGVDHGEVDRVNAVACGSAHLAAGHGGDA